MEKSGESSPFLPNQNGEAGIEDEKKASATSTLKNGGDPPCETIPLGPTADGLPVNGIGRRSRWNSPIISYIGIQNDEFCSSDLEVCVLGTVAPCVLYATNVERLEYTPSTFANQCMPYTGLYALGNAFFGWNCLAPWFSYPVRTAIRRRFNLEGSCEVLTRTCGCCGRLVEDEVQLEQYEMACDFATHVLCHPCALCQEGREVRRRLPHPGFSAWAPVPVMIPPTGQTMGRPA